MGIIDLLYNLPSTSRRQFLVAYSGGLDSHVLLHALTELRRQCPDLLLRAVHVNHHLSINAEKWAQHCATICRDLQVELIISDIVLDKTLGESLEAQARRERYRIFVEILRAHEILLTAHHLDDQAETVLLQLFRGCGIKGLSGISESCQFGKGQLVRPFLRVSRADLTVYAEQYQLDWVEDESNQHVCFDRNFLRHEIFPKLRLRWPAVQQNLARAASYCSEADSLLKQFAEKDFNKIFDITSQTLNIPDLLTYPQSQQRNLLRYWLSELGYCLPTEKKLLELQKSVLQASPDARPVMKWKGVEIRRYRSRLYAMAPISRSGLLPKYKWRLSEDLILPHQTLSLQGLKALGKQHLHCDFLTVKFRQGGESIKLKGQTRSLKKLMQEWGIPPWYRNSVPLLYKDEHLIGVYGYCLAD